MAYETVHNYPKGYDAVYKVHHTVYKGYDAVYKVYHTVCKLHHTLYKQYDALYIVLNRVDVNCANRELIPTGMSTRFGQCAKYRTYVSSQSEFALHKGQV